MKKIKKCVICFNKLQTAKKLDCNHEFCLVCIINNLKYSNKCPLCRRTITKKEIRKIYNSQIFTKSKTIDKRNDELKSILLLYLREADELLDENKCIINTINKIYKLIYNNLWFLKKNNQLTETLIKKLNEFINCGWEEGKIWKYKLKKKGLY